MNKPRSLRRVIGLPLLTFYGIGTMLGAGVYVLVGKVALASGIYAPAAFLVAALVVLFTALSYGELASRFPKSAGEAVYVDKAFGWRRLSQLVGLSVAFSGMVSAAVMARGFAGYLSWFVSLPDALAMLLFVGGLAAVAAWGVMQSVLLSALITLVEVAGVGLLLMATGKDWLPALQQWQAYLPPLTFEVWQGVMLGAFLAFYAYIGFEDMVNMAEEVKAPARNMPRAILLALLLTTFLYVLVAWAAVTTLPLAQLGGSRAPFSLLVEQSGAFPAWGITMISLIAISNGALVQIIMGARVLYGLAAQGQLPAALGHIHPVTRTPLLATGLVALLVLFMAWALPITALAKITSGVLLGVFALVNLALLVIRYRDGKAAPQVLLSRPVSGRPLIPAMGFVLCLALLFVQLL